MSQVADVITALEAKVKDEQNKRVAAEANLASQTALAANLQAQLTAQAGNVLDDADKAAIADAKTLLGQ